MMTSKEKVLAGIAAIVVGYLVLGDHVLPYRLQPTTLLSSSGTGAPSNGATFPQDTRAQATAFCVELITNRYNRVDVYQMLSSGMQTHLIDQHKAWREAGGLGQTPACVINIRSRLEDGLYQTLGNIGEALLGSMGHAAALNLALDRCISQTTSSC